MLAPRFFLSAPDPARFYLLAFKFYSCYNPYHYERVFDRVFDESKETG